MLGKRKRETAVLRRYESKETPRAEEPSSRDLFRQYFESAFEPLPDHAITAPSQLEDRSEGESGVGTSESDWAGLSDDSQEDVGVQVVEHQTLQQDETSDGLRSSNYKAFMSSKPPRDTGYTSRTGTDKPLEEDEFETTNLKHDLDLQRLLQESHLLEQAKSSLPGVHRHKATDMRMLALGSGKSTLTQEKMPLSHRRGINNRKATKEALRRKDAKENGIILEKVAMTTKNAPVRRDRAVDVPAVGRFRGGTLRLNRQDIATIQGPSRTAHRKKRGRS